MWLSQHSFPHIETIFYCVLLMAQNYQKGLFKIYLFFLQNKFGSVVSFLQNLCMNQLT